jgi:hypothetical protein
MTFYFVGGPLDNQSLLKETWHTYAERHLDYTETLQHTMNRERIWAFEGTKVREDQTLGWTAPEGVTVHSWYSSWDRLWTIELAGFGWEKAGIKFGDIAVTRTVDGIKAILDYQAAEFLAEVERGRIEKTEVERE